MAGRGGVRRENGMATPISMPASVKKMVQSLKEIVNCPEPEIYAMLKECGMDPHETVNRLLSQDTFHEVKSKREKKKEMKEFPESRTRAVNRSSSRGSRISVNREGRSTSTHFSSSDYGSSCGNPVNKKDNEENGVPTSSVMGLSISGSNLTRKSTGLSEMAVTENRIQAASIDNGISSSLQPSTGFQQNWMGKPGHVTMADIVRMGRPQGKPSSFMPSETPQTSHNGVTPSTSQYNASHFPSLPVLEAAKISHKVEDELPVPDISDTSASCADPSTSSTLHADEVGLEQSQHLDEVRLSDGNTDESQSSESTRSPSAREGQIGVDNYENEFQVDDRQIENASSYHSPRHAFEHEEVKNGDEEISSTVADLHKLRLETEELAATSGRDHPAVIIPSHLQVIDADCSYLNFGSFGSYPSKQVQTNLEVAQVADDAPPLGHSDARNLEYYENDQLQSTSNEHVASRAVTNTRDYENDKLQATSNEHIASRAVTNTRDYDMPSVSQPDISRDNALHATERLHLNLSSASGYSFPAITQPNTAAYTYPQTSLQMVEQRVLSVPQQTPQTLLSTSNPAGSRLPQHLLPVQSYSQQTLPVGHLPNVISYPVLPQSYSYLPPTAFQQTYTGNGRFQQSPGGVHSAGMKYTLPQYKSSISGARLPQSAAGASAYGGFGSSTNIPGGFPLSDSTSAARSAMGFDEGLSMQYKEGNHYLFHQQNDNSLWMHGGGLRTAPALPSGSLYSFRGQSQLSGYRQGQQPSQFEAMGYLNMYQPQAGSTEHRNPRVGNLNGSQGLQSQQSHQIWQNGH